MDTQLKGSAPLPSSGVTWEFEADVVVAGSGAAAMSVAVTSLAQGDSVVIVERSATLGGTTAKAAAAYWIPGNKMMRENGPPDSRDGALRYMARLSSPTHYDPHSPTLGLPAWEFELFSAFYDNASAAVEHYEELGAFAGVWQADVPDYLAHIPENGGVRGRVFGPMDDNGGLGDGSHMIARFTRWVRDHAGVILTQHRAERLFLNAVGEVVGLQATHMGVHVNIRAKKAVVFATGGFTHNEELRRGSLPEPIWPGCAALTNEGDFIPIATAVGGQLRNMGNAWLTPIPVEKAILNPSELIGSFNIGGDSMLFVNKYGRRVANEKSVYNELAQSFLQWDFSRAEYPNSLLFMIYDERSAVNFASEVYGNPIPPSGADHRHVIVADSLRELAAALSTRLSDIADRTGGLALAPGFFAELERSIARFNELAASGVDDDFHRGDTPIEQAFYGWATPDVHGPNTLMYPLAGNGPYYGVILAPGTLDTKGGPKTNAAGQVLGSSGEAIPGLYGVGNCVASASAQGYFAAGATIGPILTFGYLAARSAHKEPTRPA